MKKPKFVLGALCLVLGAGVADACTGMYAGKKVTTDGAVKPSDAAGFFSVRASVQEEFTDDGGFGGE